MDKLKLHMEVLEMEKELKEKKKQLKEICDHKYYDGNSAFSYYDSGRDKTKTCLICEHCEWAK